MLFVPHRRVRRQVFASVATCALAGYALAAPTLRCQIEQGGTTQVVNVRPGTNPYDFKAIDVQGRFRFRAAVVGTDQHIDYIKLYTYYQTPEQPVLMHIGKFLSPPVPPAGSSTPLTGEVTLISPRLGREIRYSCALLEDGA